MTNDSYDQTPILCGWAWGSKKPSPRRGEGENVEKVAGPLFRGGLHESFVLISCEIVSEAFVRSVISEVHPPGDPLLPLLGNSPCAPENDEIHNFIPSPLGDGTPCRRAFSISWPSPRRGEGGTAKGRDG